MAGRVRTSVQPPFLGPAAPGPEAAEREKVFAEPIAALAFRNSIFWRSISSFAMSVTSYYL
jgi:hypothetical protein